MANDAEINEAVARKLGWTEETVKLERGHIFVNPGDPEEPDCDCQNWKHGLPDYCHSIEAAWEVVESIKDGKFAIYKDNPDGFTVTDGQSDEYSTILARADTAPMAICLAFLKMGEK